MVLPAPPESGFVWDFSLSFLLVFLLLFISAFFIVLAVRQYLKRRFRPKDDTPPKKPLFSGITALVALAATLVLSIITGTTGMLFSAWGGIFFLGCAALALLLQVFRKTVGTLVSLLLILSIGLGILFLRSLTAFTGRTKIATVSVLEADQDGFSLLLEAENTQILPHPLTLRMEGERFGVLVYQIIFDDYAVFFGAKTRYAWLGMTAFDRNFAQTDLHLFPDLMQRKKIFEQAEARELVLPFVKSVQADIAIKMARESSYYEIYIENDGGITIQAVSKPQRDG
jgi:hypothetical protein